MGQNAWFGYFWTGIWKQYSHIWSQQPRIWLMAKFCQKIKILKFRLKNALFGYFWARNWTIAIFETTTLEFDRFAEFREKMTMAKLGTKNVCYRYFWAGNWKQYSNIWLQYHRTCLIAKLREKMKFPNFETKNALFENF